MKFEVGTSYKTRRGWRALVVADDLSQHLQPQPLLVVHYRDAPRYNESKIHYANGHYMGALIESPYDLVAEWVEPPKPYECYLVYGDSVHAAQFPTLDRAQRYVSASDHHGPNIKHMREVVGE